MSKNKKTVTAPLSYDPGKGRPKEYLAYLNWQEMQALRRLNGNNMERGPMGLPSFPPDWKGPENGTSSGNWTGSGGTTSPGGTVGGGSESGNIGGTESGTTSSAASNAAAAAAAASEQASSDAAAQQAAAQQSAAEAARNAAVREDAAKGGIASINVGPMQTPVQIGGGQVFGTLSEMAQQATAPSSYSTVSPTMPGGGGLGAYNAARGSTTSYVGPSSGIEAPGNIAPTYSALKVAQVMSLPSMQNLVKSMPEARFAAERRLMSGLGPLTEEEMARGKLGNFTPSSGFMKYSPEAYGDPFARPDDVFKPVGYEGDISKIYSHEVAGHGVNRAIGSQLTKDKYGYALSYDPLKGVNKNISSLTSIRDPVFQETYKDYLGDEALARATELQGDVLSNNLAGYATSSYALGELAPDIYGSFADQGKSDYFKDLQEQKREEVLKLIESNQPTAYELARGLASFSGDPSEVYGGWTPSPYSGVEEIASVKTDFLSQPKTYSRPSMGQAPENTSIGTYGKITDRLPSYQYDKPIGPNLPSQSTLSDQDLAQRLSEMNRLESMPDWQFDPDRYGWLKSPSDFYSPNIPGATQAPPERGVLDQSRVDNLKEQYRLYGEGMNTIAPPPSMEEIPSPLEVGGISSLPSKRYQERLMEVGGVMQEVGPENYGRWDPETRARIDAHQQAQIYDPKFMGPLSQPTEKIISVENVPEEEEAPVTKENYLPPDKARPKFVSPETVQIMEDQERRNRTGIKLMEKTPVAGGIAGLIERVQKVFTGKDIADYGTDLKRAYLQADEDQKAAMRDKYPDIRRFAVSIGEVAPNTGNQFASSGTPAQELGGKNYQSPLYIYGSSPYLNKYAADFEGTKGDGSDLKKQYLLWDKGIGIPEPGDPDYNDYMKYLKSRGTSAQV